MKSLTGGDWGHNNISEQFSNIPHCGFWVIAWSETKQNVFFSRLASSPLKTMEGHTKGVLSLAWCKDDSDLLMSCGKDNRILVWNPNSPQVNFKFYTCVFNAVFCVCCSLHQLVIVKHHFWVFRRSVTFVLSIGFCFQDRLYYTDNAPV